MLDNPQMNSNSSQSPERLRIMVVEDDPDIGIILKQLLGAKYEIVHAVNGLEALERLNWYQPDITVMDLMMPILNGIDTTRAIKKDNEYSAMPVLFLTARKDNHSVREAMLAGGDIYLEKPFDPVDLFIRIQDIVEKNQLQPRPKSYTLDQIKAHFEGSAETAIVPPPAGPTARMSLTEQLARAAAVPRARVVAIHNAPDALSALQRTLREAFEFIGVRNAESALDKISAYQPDILILAARAGSISGLLMAHLLRINKHFRVPLIMIISTESFPDEQEQASRMGIHWVVWDQRDASRIADQINELSKASGFHRARKRLDYREILRREEPEENEL